MVFSQNYFKGDQLTTNAKLSDYKISYEYLTWPYPVGGRHFRLKTLWQVQYVTMKTVFDAPIKSATPDSTGSLTDYSTIGSKSYITPAFGLGVHEYATRNFRLEANLSGFWLPHRFNLLDSDASFGLSRRTVRTARRRQGLHLPHLAQGGLLLPRQHGRRLRRLPLVFGLGLVGQWSRTTASLHGRRLVNPPSVASACSHH